MPRPVRPGDPLKGNLTADWFNTVSRKVVHNNQPDGDKTIVEPRGDYFMLDNNDETVVEQYFPVLLTGQAHADTLDTTDKQTVMLKCKKPASGLYNNDKYAWGITQDTVVGNTIPGRVVSIGITWAWFFFTDNPLNHKYLKFSTSNHRLESTAEKTSTMIISFTVAMSGDALGLILIGGNGSGGLWSRFELTSGLLGFVGAIAGAIFQDGSTGTVVNTGTWRAFTGAIGVAVLVNGLWSIITVQEPADFLVEMGANSPVPAYPTPNATASIYPASKEMITLYPNDFNSTLPSEVANPLLLNSHDGDIGTVRFDKSIDAYILTHVAPAKQKIFWARLTTDKPLGLYENVEISPYDDGHLGDGEYFPSTRTVDEYPQEAVDLFNKALNAKEGDKCLVAFDPEANTYKIIECDHIATRWLGSIYQDFDTHPDTFEVEFVRAYDGRDVPGVTVEIENRWKYEAMKAGELIDIAYDPVTGVWYPLELQCPEDPTPVYF